MAKKKRQPIGDMFDANLWLRWQERPELTKRRAPSEARKAKPPIKAKTKARRSAPP
jgi:hypothetical protein